jgi:aryl-phospho-beta-D-glucosidase BglC (GH1 family)
MKKKCLLKIINAALCALALLSACSPGKPSDRWIGADDALDVDANGYLRNQKGREVVLRGVNLGGWMIQESWMCPVSGNDREWANLDTIRAMEGRGWTAAQIQELFDTYQDNWITVDDFDFLKAQGVNSIRIPFWYRNFMADEAGAWINDDNGSEIDTTNPGFRRLDWAITQAKERGIYVILDLHGAPGGQAMDHSCGTVGKNELYTNAAYEQATVDLWTALAKRYKDQAAVVAYDLLNEPQNNGGYSGPNAWVPGSTRAIRETIRLYDRLYREIRAVDTNTIIIMEGIWSMNLPNPKYILNGKQTVWDKNVMYSMHIYDHALDTKSPPSPGGTINYRVYELTEARRKWGVAIHIGEFNNDRQGNQVAAYQLYNDSKINWNMWTYKIAGANMGSWSLYQARDKAKADPQTDDFETIKEKWGATLRTFSPGTNTPANGYARTGVNMMIPGIITDSSRR